MFKGTSLSSCGKNNLLLELTLTHRMAINLVDRVIYPLNNWP